MQPFDSSFELDMDDSLSLCSQSFPCPSTDSSFTVDSPIYDPFTPSPTRSTPPQHSPESDSYQGTRRLDMTLSLPRRDSTIFGHAVKNESEVMPFFSSLPSTPVKRTGGFLNDYSQMLDPQITQHVPMSSFTPSRFTGMNTMSPDTRMGSYMMTPSRSLPGSETGFMEGGSAWPFPSAESPVSFFSLPGAIDSWNLERHSHSPSALCSLGPIYNTTDRLCTQREMMLLEAQRRTGELPQAPLKTWKRKFVKEEDSPGDGVREEKVKCDWPGCGSSYCRNEHLKRHITTHHSKKRPRYRCEFCGKDSFNREDNLNTHRKLHARRNHRSRGVDFMEEAVAVIEMEERARRKRASSKAKASARAV